MQNKIKIAYFRKRNLIFLKNLKKIANAFNKKKIDVIILKGAAYVIDTQDISERVFNDIDILIK